MLRFCLLLGLALPIWATPITGAFDISARSNFVDILGDGFAWQFHQGNAGAVFTACTGTECSLDGSAAPATFALLKPENWFRAVDASTVAQGNLNPGEVTGSIGGSFSWHVARTDWSDVPIGGPVALAVPMEITGLLTASDSQGNLFMEKVLSGTGNFETAVVRTDSGVMFFGAAGRFDGTVAGKEEPVQETAPGATGLVPSPGEPAAGPGSDTAGSASSGSGTAAAPDPGADGGSDLTPVPEPAAYTLLALGLAAIAAVRRRLFA